MSEIKAGNIDLLAYQQELLRRIESSADDSAANSIYVVVGGTTYAINASCISEASMVPKLTHIPGMKPWVLGMGNVRARMIPVVSLDRYLGHPLGDSLVCLTLARFPLAFAASLDIAREAAQPFDPEALMTKEGAWSQLIDIQKVVKT